VGRGKPCDRILSRALASAARTAKAARMIETRKILLLAGSLEARRVAEALSAQAVLYDAWLSEAPRGAALLPQVPQLRRFAQAGDFEQAVHACGYRAVLDAGHGFERAATRHAYLAARTLGLPFLRLERPAWSLADRRHWRRAADAAQACAMIGPGARVFCALGWDSLPDFAEFKGDVLMLRQTRRHARPAPYAFVQMVFGDPPFSVADEQKLFAELQIDTLVCRNIGGHASHSKLDAAAALGLEVIVVDRPAFPAGLPVVDNVQAALDWVAAL
tara:strand:+ start:339 stop:1160 length:822 start_codon:yes stop_codon:yes gene_type:complete